MAWIGFVLSGLLTGIMLSAPIGAANILCLKQTLQYGRISGFLTGLGAAFGDFLFVLVSITGLMIISDKNAAWLQNLGIFGGVMLIITGGYGLFFAKNISYHPDTANDNLPKRIYLRKNILPFFSSFFLTVTNPLTPIGVFTAVSAVGLGGGFLRVQQSWESVVFALSILTGAILWWIFLTITAKAVAKKLSYHILNRISKTASFLIAIIGIYLLLKIMS